MMKQLSFLFLLSLLFFGCVSKKNHLAYINSLKKTQETAVQQLVAEYGTQLSTAKKSIRDLELQLAERKGENNILVQLRQELLDSISYLQSSIKGLSQRSASTQQDLSSTLAKKDQQIHKLHQQLKSVDAVLDKHLATIGRVAGDLRFVLQELNPNVYNMSSTQMRIKMSIVETMLFQKGSNSRITDQGYTLLEKIAAVFSKYPNMQIQITGHTDNSPPRRKSDGDNWNVSVIRGACITRLFIEDFGINPNQLTAAGKGEFAPIDSNAT
ncbi:MAG TPA: hypothetical protein ENK52_05925, partial [Saprospiraceae bacterium]|nr:hypothetical protein [Saprospiraceae bacterium]